MELETITLKASPKELTILALITLIIAASEDGYANNFKEEFYLRYRQKIYDYCLHIANKNFGRSSEWKHICEDVVQDTFIFAIFNLKEFKFEENWGDKKLNNKLIGWLGSIAQHKLFDHYNKDRGKEEDVAAFQYDLKKNLQRKKTANTADLYVLERTILDEAMQKIKERDRAVLYTYLEHGCLHGKKSLPDNVMKELCSKWNLTAGNARQIKGRTFELLRKLCIEQKN